MEFEKVHTPASFMKCMTVTEVNWLFVLILTTSSMHPREGKEISIISI